MCSWRCAGSKLSSYDSSWICITHCPVKSLLKEIVFVKLQGRLAKLERRLTVAQHMAARHMARKESMSASKQAQIAYLIAHSSRLHYQH